MPLTPGTRLGPYEIVAPLGAGGMGEVYRARDTRLGRDVAVKVLPTHLSDQPETRARFEREARTVSSLNHPHICTLFDVGREADTDYLVLELVEGGTLEARLLRGPLPPAEALRLGTQIADALDRAHRAGVIHRDLKPGNIMLTRAGAKLMDFGLARATGLDGAGAGTMAHSPTMGRSLTAEGTILGTFQYMAPEQLEGREADARSDIWALGCVLYEMFTGRRAFEGRSQASLIAAILEREPAPIGERPSDAPPAAASVMSQPPPPGTERLLRNCLAKDPDERIQTAHDVKLHLQAIAEGAGYGAVGPGAGASSPGAGAPRAAAHRRGVPWPVAAAAAAALLAAGAGLGSLALRPRAAAVPPIRFRVDAPPGTTDAFWPRVSPDGRHLVFEAVDSTGTLRAYVRPLGEIEARAIPGTENLTRAYWSPDGRELAFIADGKLQRVSIAGGAPVVVTSSPLGADLSWGRKGQILMDGRTQDSIMVIAAAGGEFRPAARIDRAAGEAGSAWPCFLPDGEHFLFLGTRDDVPAGGNIRLGRLGSLESKLLGRSDGRVEFAPGGWVLFLRETSLLAQRLDVRAGKLTGDPIRIADGVRIGSAEGHYSVSPSGILAISYVDGGVQRTIQAADRAGNRSAESLARGTIIAPELSPDGQRLLYQRTVAGSPFLGDIHAFDLGRRTDTRVTFSGGMARAPRWAPDGRRFAFQTRTGPGRYVLRIGSADGLGVQDTIPMPVGSAPHLTQWAPDSSIVLWDDRTVRPWRVRLAGEGRAGRWLLDSTSTLANPRISPDGRWVAGSAGRLPDVHVFVHSLTGTPGRWQISTTPATNPVWTRGGRELVYESFDGRLMAVDVDTGNGFRPGVPRPLFRLPMSSPSPNVRSWTCDAAGERFYLVTPPQATNATRLEVLTNFTSLVNRR